MKQVLAPVRILIFLRCPLVPLL
uniref:Uncharacterized protein n=1 Tax=Anguilla anguilla TaxID=7936 RepID=A0A0E9U3Z7_ANGAN